MKIAIVTNNGSTVSQHFGRAPYYKIFEIEDNKVNNVYLRERRTGHFAPGGMLHNHEHHQETSAGHGYGRDAQNRHATMVQELSDCKVLIAGGMGMGAYENFRNSGLEVILTDHRDINEALDAYLRGDLENLMNQRTH
jgi:predicted Fe-Mo cluster-binding NifX family protein